MMNVQYKIKKLKGKIIQQIIVHNFIFKKKTEIYIYIIYETKNIYNIILIICNIKQTNKNEMI